jgi:hypothetical protein
MRQHAWVSVVAIGLFGASPRAQADDGEAKPAKPVTTKVARAKPSKVDVAKPEPAPSPVHEFIDDAKELLVVGACAEGSSTKVKPELVAAHCKTVKAAQDEYRKSWLGVATEFFKAHVPAGLPKTVVYPFAGGDLSTALTVYPDADEITTLALEPAGDARALSRLSEDQIKASLAVVATELGALYTSNFSKTMNMINAMRGGQLPTQLIFSLSALHLHGYEPVALRYFKLDGAGDVVYLTDADLKKIDAVKDPGMHNRALGDVELKFRKIGSKREQIYRHIMANLDNAHLKTTPAPLRHLEKKGHVAGMTKAASYLLSFGDFSIIRKYVMDHVDWMVSDTTGLPPSYGVPAGFEYETYGEWQSSNMAAGNGAVRATWKQLFATQPKHELAFRFGYPNGAGTGHLVFMKRGTKPAPTASVKSPAKSPVKPAPPTK